MAVPKAIHKKSSTPVAVRPLGEGEMPIEQKSEQAPFKQAEAVKVVLDLDPNRYLEAIGRRKTCTARVRTFYIPEDKREAGQIHITVNARPYLEYFKVLELQKAVDAPLRKLKLQDVFSVSAKTSGGGFRGQAEAIRHGLSKILAKLDPEWHKRLKRSKFLTRDPRAVERKKYGRHKARKGHQWHKR